MPVDIVSGTKTVLVKLIALGFHDFEVLLKIVLAGRVKFCDERFCPLLPRNMRPGQSVVALIVEVVRRSQSFGNRIDADAKLENHRLKIRFKKHGSSCERLAVRDDQTGFHFQACENMLQVRFDAAAHNIGTV